MEQQKLTTKSQLQSSEALPNFDPVVVLTKALSLVPLVSSAEDEPSAAARSPASDSFDENTFYSSQHDTPEPFSSPSGQKEPGEVLSNDATSIDERRTETLPMERRELEDLLPNDNHLATQLSSQTRRLPPHMPEHTRSAVAQEHAEEMTNSESSSSRGPPVRDVSDVSSKWKDGIRIVMRHVHPQISAINVF